MSKAKIGLTAALLFSAACGVAVDSTPYETNPLDPRTGLYTPGNTVGADPNSDGGIAVSMQDILDSLLDMASGNTCGLPPDLGMTQEEAETAKNNNVPDTRAHTPGTLSVRYTTKPQNTGIKWAPSNVGAVWIADVQNRFVKKLEQWAAERVMSLVVFTVQACPVPEPDVVGSATLMDYGQHMAMWNGKDHAGNVVPDGSYQLYIEVAETEKSVKRTVFPFIKGPMSLTQNVPDSDTSATTDLTVSYTPTTGTAPATPPTGP